MLAFDSSATPPTTDIVAKPARGHESYIALVWRRLRRSWTGMAGLVLVVLLLLMAIFADFFAPMDPKATDVGFAPPQMMSFHDKDGNFVFQPRVYTLSDSKSSTRSPSSRSSASTTTTRGCSASSSRAPNTGSSA